MFDRFRTVFEGLLSSFTCFGHCEGDTVGLHSAMKQKPEAFKGVPMSTSSCRNYSVLPSCLCVDASSCLLVQRTRCLCIFRVLKLYIRILRTQGVAGVITHLQELFGADVIERTVLVDAVRDADRPGEEEEVVVWQHRFRLDLDGHGVQRDQLSFLGQSETTAPSTSVTAVHLFKFDQSEITNRHRVAAHIECGAKVKSL